ncbi:MAG: phytanoyl-CoA dioxygenase family protein [Cephaloticoccus sp.]|nr:phytanoyl-CoA dioxygenase family protein [Cephaloticoccus sp.]MCF7758873.1 phytanoyl-CoA dioxygenase family protein [Cephaloticoccus sp.]
MSLAPTKQFDHGSDMHVPELYQPLGVGHGVEHFEDIGPAEITQFREQGYLIVRQAFDSREVNEAIQGLVDLIMGKNPEFTGISFEAKAQDILPTLGLEARQDAVRKLMFFVEYDARLKAISHHPKLLKTISTLLGDRPSQMFQDMALLKPPRLGREKPWHQDNAYFNYPQGTSVVGTWIALDEATIENGCMQFLPGQHKKGPQIHFQRRDWQICDTEILGQRSVAAPLKPGGMLFFSGLLPHGTPHNSSGLRRRALQFHYAPADVSTLPDNDERLKHFGSEGKDVSC